MFRPDPKPEPKIKIKKKYVYKRKATGEKEVFEKIANTRKLRSYINDEPLGELTASNFLHVLPKGKNQYPLFKTYEKNIVLGTHDQHHLWDNGTRGALKLLPEWDKMFKLESELKEEYKNLPNG